MKCWNSKIHILQLYFQCTKTNVSFGKCVWRNNVHPEIFVSPFEFCLVRITWLLFILFSIFFFQIIIWNHHPFCRRIINCALKRIPDLSYLSSGTILNMVWVNVRIFIWCCYFVVWYFWIVSPATNTTNHQS